MHNIYLVTNKLKKKNYNFQKIEKTKIERIKAKFTKILFILKQGQFQFSDLFHNSSSVCRVESQVNDINYLWRKVHYYY